MPNLKRVVKKAARTAGPMVSKATGGAKKYLKAGETLSGYRGVAQVTKKLKEINRKSITRKSR